MPRRLLVVWFPLCLRDILGTTGTLPGISLRRILVSSSLLGFLERSLTHDDHSSNGVLYDAWHRSQNITQLDEARHYALHCPSDGCTPQMLNRGASPAF